MRLVHFVVIFDSESNKSTRLRISNPMKGKISKKRKTSPEFLEESRALLEEVQVRFRISSVSHSPNLLDRKPWESTIPHP